tara:strand:+ start:899 stop:1279 length:381 start_codon:yes stop_codon:yes gene_type:complete
MAFKMNRGNLGKQSSTMMKKNSPNQFIRMGISKRVRKLFGGKRSGKGGYSIDRGLFGPLDLSGVKDFFGKIGDKFRNRKRLSSNIDGGRRSLPTEIARASIKAGGTRYKKPISPGGNSNKSKFDRV